MRWGKLTRLVGGENNEVALLLHGRFKNRRGLRCVEKKEEEKKKKKMEKKK